MKTKRRLVLCIECHHATAEIGTSHCRYCARHATAQRSVATPREQQLSFVFEVLAHRLAPTRYDNLTNRPGTIILDKRAKV